MVADASLNVYSGEEALWDYYNPDNCPPVPLVELPRKLNPFREDGVRIYAKLMNCLPATNVKALPALNMLLRGQEDGRLTAETHTIIEYSSGSTVISLSLLSNILGLKNPVKAYMSNKTSQDKLDLLRFYGINLTVFAGHGQPEPQDPNGGIYRATVDGQREGCFNPDQYSNPHNYEAHIRWTGPQILRQLPKLSVFVASIGTSGTMTGSGLYIKEKRPFVTSVGVCTAPDERVPGPRSFSLLAPVEFPWRDSLDCIEEIPSFESFEKSLELCRSGLLVGPSSGLALLGLLKYLEREKTETKQGEQIFSKLRNEDGEVVCVFICCDAPFQYVREYMDKLGPSYFPAIHNSELLTVDPYWYNVDWEIPTSQAHSLLFDPNYQAPVPVGIQPVRGVKSTPTSQESGKANYLVLDLRDKPSFEADHVPNSQNLPLDSLSDPNPYMNPPAMVKQFRILDGLLSPSSSTRRALALEDYTILALSHRGNLGRLATSVLRAKGITALGVIGGSEDWKSTGLWGKW